MLVTINNQSKEVKAVTVQELHAELGLPEKGVAIAIANKMIPRAEWENTSLKENDNIVVIKAAFGG